VCVYTAAAAVRLQRQTSSPVYRGRPASAQPSVGAGAASFVPIDPAARTPPPAPAAQQQQPRAGQALGQHRRRLPDIPGTDSVVPDGGVVLRQHPRPSVDGVQRQSRPDSGVGSADLGVSATAVLYAAAASASSRDTRQLSSPGEPVTDITVLSIRQIKLYIIISTDEEVM